MPHFEPKNPDYRAAANAIFDGQQAMQTLGISMVRLEPGEIDLSMPYSSQWTQQNGFIHAGIVTAALDTACGIAAFTLMPADSDILTVEFKTNLLAPARRAICIPRQSHKARSHAHDLRGAGFCDARWRGSLDRDDDRDAHGVAAP